MTEETLKDCKCVRRKKEIERLRELIARVTKEDPCFAEDMERGRARLERISQRKRLRRSWIEEYANLLERKGKGMLACAKALREYAERIQPWDG